MEIDAWYDAALTDARRRRLHELEALLRGLCAATHALRAADFVDDASGTAEHDPARPAETRR
jgi:hypothetical protein